MESGSFRFTYLLENQLKTLNPFRKYLSWTEATLESGEQSTTHQQKKFYLIYYIHISLYGLVIPPPLIPPIPPVFTSCSKARGGLLEAPYIPSAPFILIAVRGPRLAPLVNWSRLTDPSFFCHFIQAIFDVERPLHACARPEKPLLGSGPLTTLGTSSSP